MNAAGAQGRPWSGADRPRLRELRGTVLGATGPPHPEWLKPVWVRPLEGASPLAAPAEPGTQVTGWATKASTKQSDRQFIDTCCVYPARQRLKSTLHPRCRHRRRMTQGQRGSLLLSCGVRASPTLCRFIPALSLRPLFVSLFVSQPLGCLAPDASLVTG